MTWTANLSYDFANHTWQIDLGGRVRVQGKTIAAAEAKIPAAVKRYMRDVERACKREQKKRDAEWAMEFNITHFNKSASDT